MPEGDTVWRTARHLDRALSGHRILACDLRVPAYATVDLTGATVEQTVSRGKHLLTRIGAVPAAVPPAVPSALPAADARPEDGTIVPVPGAATGTTLHTHLRMEGSWHLYRTGTRWRRPTHEARVVLRTEGWTAVGFALGVVELLARDAEDTAVGHLGPDLLGPDWDESEALRRLRTAPDRPVGEALLDQRNLAGIGNLYRNELCFLAGVHPQTPVDEVADLPRLVRRARSALDANKERVEQTFTGDLRRGRQTWVYRRERQPCRRCGTPVRVAQTGPATQERAVYWCPICQPGPG